MTENISKREIKKKLQPGIKITLVHNFRGECKDHRTVKRITRDELAMNWGEDERPTYCDIPEGQWIEKTDNGFIFRYGQGTHQYLEYKWGHI